MVIVRLAGGLGNQMFQYAMARTVAHRRESQVAVDLRTLRADNKRRYGLEAWSVNATLASTFAIWRLEAAMRVHRAIKPRAPYYDRPIVRERSCAFDGDALKAPSSCILVGYWQSEKYFKEIEGTIRCEFTLRSKPSMRSERIAAAIRQVPNSVFLHVRRGDLASDPTLRRLHGVCSLEYYYAAADRLSQVATGIHVFVFSDEPDWVVRNLNLSLPTTVIDHNVPGNAQIRGSEHEDLWLMSLCRHGILSNSSFSWWGAWLNPEKDRIVVAPRLWTNELQLDDKDLILGSWIRL